MASLVEKMKCDIRNGSFGTVQLAIQNNIKMARKKFISSVHFDKELSVYKQLQKNPCSGIAKLLNYTESELELEWLDYTLEEAIKNRIFAKESFHNIKLMIYDISIALEHLYHIGIVHNDIKPQNIMYSQSENKWKLIDFGSASLANDLDNFSYESTLLYMAPERCLQQEWDIRSDIWSLGICLLQCFLEGRHPIDFIDDCSDVYFGVCFELNQFMNKIPQSLCQLLKGMLQYNKEKRFLPSDVIDLLRKESEIGKKQ